MSEETSIGTAHPEIQEFAAFAEEFKKEGDRGAVLLAASRLDEVLKNILLAHFRDTPSAKALLKGALSSLSARANIAHSLALIEDSELAEIDRIREIRNIFAHQWRDIGFESAKIKELCEKLPLIEPGEQRGGVNSCRARFVSTTIVLLTDLLWRERLVAMGKIKPRTWPNKMRAKKLSDEATGVVEGAPKKAMRRK